MDTFAARVKAIREAKGVSPYRLARLAGLSKQGGLNLEKEGSDPRLSTVLKVAEALCCSPWELLPGWSQGSTEPARGTPA